MASSSALASEVVCLNASRILAGRDRGDERQNHNDNPGHRCRLSVQENVGDLEKNSGTELPAVRFYLSPDSRAVTQGRGYLCSFCQTTSMLHSRPVMRTRTVPSRSILPLASTSKPMFAARIMSGRMSERFTQKFPVCSG